MQLRSKKKFKLVFQNYYKKLEWKERARIQTHGATVGAGVWDVVVGCVEVGGAELVVWAYKEMWLNYMNFQTPKAILFIYIKFHRLCKGYKELLTTVERSSIGT